MPTRQNQSRVHQTALAFGWGMSSLTNAGAKELRRRQLAYKRKHKIPPNRNCIDEDWFKKIKDECFAPEAEGIWWRYSGKIYDT